VGLLDNIDSIFFAVDGAFFPFFFRHNNPRLIMVLGIDELIRRFTVALRTAGTGCRPIISALFVALVLTRDGDRRRTMSRLQGGGGYVLVRGRRCLGECSD
ncbi:hypothetical protein DMW54_25005, partial [Serratia marcescens]